jgi:hypothetical protein
MKDESMVATKETVENLIQNASQVIEDFYTKICDDNCRLEHYDEKSTNLLRCATELRRDIRFVLIDLLTSLRACLKSEHYFEKIYHIKNLEGARVEGYNLLCGFKGTKQYTVWTRLGSALKEKIEDESVIELQAYNDLEKLYERISDQFDLVLATNQERTSRNLTFHYDEDLLKVYEQLVAVKNKGEDDPVKRVVPWMDLLLWIQFLCDSIEVIENLQGYKLPDVSACRPSRLKPVFWRFYKQMAQELEKQDKFHYALNLALEHVDDIDWSALQKKKLLRIQEFLSGYLPKNDQSNSLSDFIDIFNINILIHLLFADIASVMNAYMNAGCDVEYPLIFRRLSISKFAALSHLVGYDDKEKQVALWPLVQATIPNDTPLFRFEADRIRMGFDSLIQKEDIQTRALYVHLIDKYSHRSNVPAIMAKIDGVDWIIEFKELVRLVQILGSAKKFLENWMKELVKKVDKMTKESQERRLDQIKAFRELVNNVKCTDEIRSSFDESMNKIEKLINI